jgi:hypothetical protein
VSARPPAPFCRETSGVNRRGGSRRTGVGDPGVSCVQRSRNRLRSVGQEPGVGAGGRCQPAKSAGWERDRSSPGAIGRVSRSSGEPGAAGTEKWSEAGEGELCPHGSWRLGARRRVARRRQEAERRAR